MIPLLQPSISDKEIEAVTRVLSSRWWGQGKVTSEFEQKMATLYGMKNCVTTNSATAALHLAMVVLGVGPGDEVLIPALTFVSTGLAPIYVGATPVLVDIDRETLCLDWERAQEAVTERTKAVIAVDYAGYSCSIGKRELGIATVQDSAHSCCHDGYGDVVCLSFHPVKIVATGDGGAILTDRDDFADRLRALRWCGIDRSTWQRVTHKYGWEYDIKEVGYKYHWNDIQAAIGLAQLERLDELLKRRQQIAARYRDEFAGLVQLPPDCPGHAWHLFPIRVDARDRDALVDHLLANGISAGVHYKPISHYPMFSGNVPVTEEEWQRLVSLPIFPSMTNEQQDRVIRQVRYFYEKTDA